MADAADITANEPGSGVAVAGEAAPGELDLGYQVSLEAFSGPLDLLLFLVRRAEVDVADIPISTIADQFIAAISSWQELDLDVAGDFILMAATLLEIKSRLVAPPDEPKEEGEGAAEEEDLFDPRAGLISQLLSYCRFKEATQLLAGLEDLHHRRLARQLHEIIPEDPDEADGIDLGNCDPGLLFAVWEKVLAKISGLGPRTVLNDDVPLGLKITALVDAMRASREARLSWMFEKDGSRIGRVGTLMATLECVRQRFIEALQHEQYGEVFLRYREDQERASADAVVPPPEPPEEPKRRRRRLPLVTWQPPQAAAGAETEAEAAEDEAKGAEAVEEIIETDEQRFVRELEEACAVEAVLGRTADIEGSFAAFVAARQAAAAAPPAVADTAGQVPTAESQAPSPTAPDPCQPTSPS
jgi:segregation and condensation protein A